MCVNGKMCPLHAFACMLADGTTPVGSTEAFSGHHSGSMNLMLKSIYDMVEDESIMGGFVVTNPITGEGHTLVPDATSHSGRTGKSLIEVIVVFVGLLYLGYLGCSFWIQPVPAGYKLYLLDTSCRYTASPCILDSPLFVFIVCIPVCAY